MLVLMGTVFVASLLGSLHCVGMCGPFALLAASSNQHKTATVPAMAYSVGRLTTYAVVGAIFGALGLALNKGTSFASWQQSATYLAGGLMISIGAIALARYFGFQIKLPKMFVPVSRLLQAGFARTKVLPPLRRAFSIGALTTLMPCGWLYTFAITAAGTGSPAWGTLVMVVFWAGTVPIMTALMMGFDHVSSPIQKRLPVLMASLVISIGIFTLFFRAPIVVGQETIVVSGSENLIEKIRNVKKESLPCCHSHSVDAK